MNDTTPRRPRFHGRIDQDAPCATPGCAAPGEFRAPRSNRVAGSVGGWQFLCLDHVRAFNSGYNFFDGMSPDAIAEAQSPLAGWAHVTSGANGHKFNDPLGAFEARFGPDPNIARRTRAGTLLGDKDLKALKTLGLGAQASPADIRRSYRTLLRRFHPDTNGGDRSAEAKLQDVVQAYTHLKTCPAFARPQKEP